MQALGAVTYADLAGAGQTTLRKFEVYDGAAWIDLAHFHEALTDGGLEAWASATNLTSWTETIGGTSTVNQDDTTFHGGLYSCRLDIDASNTQAAISQASVTLRRGFPYCFSGWYKTEAAKTAQLAVYNSGAANVYLQDDLTWATGANFITLAASTDWKQFKIYFTPHPAYTSYVFVFSRLAGTSSSMWVDDLSVSVVPESFVKSLSLHLGGAGATPDPVAADWSAELHNELGLFHPAHPYSDVNDLLRVGRQVRISYGGTYGGVDYYWQRLIGYMDAPTFDSAAKTVSLSGSDYCKPLVDMDLRFPYNYWGATETDSSVASFTETGAQLYNYADALDPDSEATGIDVTWATNDANSLFVSVDDGGGVYFGKYSEDDGGSGWVNNTGMGSLTKDARYIFKVKYRTPLGAGFTFELAQGTGASRRVLSSWAAQSTAGFVTEVVNFKAAETGQLEFKVIGSGLGIIYMEIDWVSLKAGLTNWNDYPMPATCNGPYYATLDGEVVSYGAPVAKDGTGGGYFYDEGTRNFYFSEDKTVEAGTNNLLISYYTDQVPENVVADILAAGPNNAGGGAGLYANRAAALAAMDYVATGITLEKVWFPDGNSGLRAIREICERCNYRFWFTGAGVPTFRPAPVMGDPILWLDTDTKSGLSTLQDLGEIRNNVVLQGIEQAMFKMGDEVDKSRLKATASDATSIAAYLEHSYAVTSNLFQDQASLTAAAAAMLAAFKDPKWYATLAVPHNPVPLELGDTVGLEIPLAPGSGTVAALDVGTRGIIRDVSLSDEGFSYKVELESGLMNIANYTTTTVAVTTEQCKGWMLTNAGAGADVHFDLPAATVGMWIRFFVQAAQTLTVDPSGTERIAVLTDTAGDYLRSDAVIGSYVVLGCLAAGVWSKLDISGTWTEEA